MNLWSDYDKLKRIGHLVRVSARSSVINDYDKVKNILLCSAFLSAVVLRREPFWAAPFYCPTLKLTENANQRIKVMPRRKAVASFVATSEGESQPQLNQSRVAAEYV